MKNLKILRARKAFTLIELIIVIAIIIIMVGVGIPMTSNYIVERSLYNAAAQVQQDIRLVQHLAITHSTTSKFKIHFDSANNSYTVETVEGGSKIITRNFNDALGFPEYFDSSLPDSDSIEFGGSSTIPIDLNFDNLGHPDPGNGYVNLQNRSGSKQIQIAVTLIGRVNIVWIQR